MFKSDLLNLLRAWLATGDEILLFGDFNEDVYSGPLAGDLARDEFRMTELCLRTTGVCLPSTHTHSWTPINVVFATSGLVCTAETLLPSLAGVGDCRVFILDIDSRSLRGDVFPCIIPVSQCLLNCALDWIKISHISLLNQLSKRHLLFKKLLLIDKKSDRLSPAMIHLHMNKVYFELEYFMKSVERDCHKYKRDNNKWSPQAGVWIRWWWLLALVKKYLHGEIRDPALGLLADLKETRKVLHKCMLR
jgi:hypothetical protein